jgi:hypothetical protein
MLVNVIMNSWSTIAGDHADFAGKNLVVNIFYYEAHAVQTRKHHVPIVGN